MDVLAIVLTIVPIVLLVILIQAATNSSLKLLHKKLDEINKKLSK